MELLHMFVFSFFSRASLLLSCYLLPLCSVDSVMSGGHGLGSKWAGWVGLGGDWEGLTRTLSES